VRAGLRPRLLIALIVTLLSACAGTGQNSPADDVRNSTDQSDLQRRAQIRLQLAVGYYGQGQLATALDEVKQALQLDPNFADAHGVRALIHMDMGEPQLAEESFKRAMKLAPGNPDFANN